MNYLSHKKSLLSLLAFAALTGSALAAADGPVKVYILAGQSNMVGIGQVTSNAVRWGNEFLNPVLSVYEGAYDPKADYDSLKPVQTLELQSFGGTKPTGFPKGGLRIVRGFIQPKASGLFQFNPGYGDSANNIMVVNGIEVHRREPGGEAVHKPVKLAAGEKLPFKITYLTEGADGLGWTTRLDVPGTLHTVVHEEGKYPYEKNLVHLIKTLRKEFNAPNAPFVVATGCGNKGREGTGLQIAEAQLAVDGDKGKYPEFKGNVKSVDIRDFWPDPAKSPKNQGFHYHQNAGTYMQIGEAMGKTMVSQAAK